MIFGSLVFIVGSLEMTSFLKYKEEIIKNPIKIALKQI